MRDFFLLDADETVLDFIRSSRESLRFMMQALSLPYREEDFALYKRINDGVWREYEQGAVTKKRLHTLRFERFFAQRGICADAERANEVYFTKLCGTGYLLPGAEAFLRELRRRGSVLLITNGTPQAQYGRLDALGIRSLFAGIYVSDEIGFAKPDPRFFAHVLASAGVGAGRCLVIGDSLTSDIAGANAAGIPCIWYDPQRKEAAGAVPSAVAYSYEEIVKIVDEGRL